VWYWYFIRIWKVAAYWLFSLVAVAIGIGGVVVLFWPNSHDRWSTAALMWLFGVALWFGIRVTDWINDRLGF